VARTGRKATPIHLKVLAGSRERDLNRDEPMPAPPADGVDLRRPPRGLGAAAAKVWRELAPDMVDKHVLTAWDVHLFEAFCRTVAHYRALEAKVRKDGHTAVGSQEQPVKSPYWAARNDALKQMLSLAARFGLSPADRAGLVMDAGANGKPTLGPERLLS
jgi:P27 family predicted phage terminase small subunit